MPNLGDLYYSLSLKDDKAKKSLDEMLQKIKSLDSATGNKIRLDSSDIEKAMATLQNVQQAVDHLKNSAASITISANNATNNLGTSFSVSQQNIAQIRSDIEKELQKGVNVTLHCRPNDVNPLITELQKVLNNRKIWVKLTPNIANVDINKIKGEIESKLKSLKLQGIVLNPDKQHIQQQLRAMNLTAPLTLTVNASQVQSQINQAVNAQGKLNVTTDQTGKIISRNNQERQEGVGWQKTINDHMRTTTQLATILGNTIGNTFSVYAVKNFLEQLIQVGGEIQKQRMALGHLLGNESEANILFGQMKDLAVKSPFGLLDLTKNARQLSAFGVEYNNLYDTMKRLSDIAAGLGIQFGRLSLAYGESMERGFLDGKIVRQFAYMGLPILQKIADYYTEINKAGNGKIFSATDVRSMVSDRLVSFEDVDAVIKRMTDAGGQFNNMQEVMAESVAGKWKNLQDAVDIMYSNIVERNSDALKVPAEILTNLTRHYEELAIILGVVATALLGYKTASLIASAAMSKETAQGWQNLMTKKRLEATEIRRAMVLGMATDEEIKSLATKKMLSRAELEELKTTENLSGAQMKQIIIRQGANKANAEALYAVGLITRAERDNLLNGNYWIATRTKMTVSLRLFTAQLKLATVEMKAMLAAMAADPMTWIFVAVGAIWEISSAIDSINEKRKEMTKGMVDAWKDMRDDAIKITQKVTIEQNSDGTLRATEAEMKIAIDNLTTFLKDKMPGVQEVLDEVFELDDNGQFKKDIDERYSILKEYYDKVKALSTDEIVMSDIDKAVDVFSGSWYNKFFTDDFFRDAADYDSASKAFRMYLERVMGDADEELEKLLIKWQKKMEVSDNTSLLEKLFQRNNVDFFQSFIQELLQEQDILDTMATNFYAYDIFEIARKEFMSEFADYNAELEKMLRNNSFFGSNFSFDEMTKEQKIRVQYILRAMIDQSEASQWVKDRLVEEYKTRWNIDLSLSGDVQEAKNLLTANFGADAGDDIAESISNGEKSYNKLRKDIEALNDAKGKTNDLAKRIELQNEIDRKQVEADLKKANFSAYGVDLEARYQASLNKSKGKGSRGGTRSDSLLKSWRDTKAIYDDMLSTFKKLNDFMSDEEAIKKMQGSGIFGDYLKGIKDEAGIKNLYKELQAQVEKSANTDDRRKFAADIVKKLFGFDTDTLKEESKKAVDIVTAEITQATKQYDVWKTWFNATGDSDASKSIALSVVPVWDEKTEGLLNQFSSKIKNATKNTFDTATGKNIWSELFSEAEAKDFFDRNEEALKIWKTIHDLIVSAGYENSKATANVLKNMMTYTEKLAVLQKEREDRLKGATTDEQRNKINQYYDSKALEMSPEYAQFFKNVEVMTKESARSMGDTIRENLTKKLNRGEITIQQYADEIKKLDEVMQKSEYRVSSMAEAYAKGGFKGLGEYLETKRQSARDNKDKATSNRDTQKAVEYANEEALYTKLLDKLSKVQNSLGDFDLALKIVKGVIDGLTQSFDALAEMYEALGDESNANRFSDMSDAIKAGSSALNPTSEVVSNAMSGNISGVISSAISAPIKTFANPITGFAKLHDKKQDRQIKLAEKNIKALNTMADRLEKELERTLGGIYNITLDADTKKQLEALVGAGKLFKGGTTSEIAKKAQEALDQDSYYDAQMALLMAQRQQVESQLSSEQDRKNSSDEAINDYKEKINKLDDQINNLAQDMADALYGINFKNWASQLGESLVQAWQNGTDAAKAYKDTVNELIASVTKNVVSQHIIETALQPVLDSFTKSFAENNGKLNQQMIVKLANDINTLAPEMVDGVYSYLNSLKDLGLDLKDTNTTSLGASVSSITEETADILAAYINAIRMDVSIIRELYASQMGSSEFSMDDHYLLQQSQLQQLRQIQENTSRNAQAAEDILSFMDDVANNRKQLYVN